MTPEQKIITIAEFEGIPTNKVFCMKFKDTEWFDHKVPLKLPPYLTSRDAICGAVARLDDEEGRLFSNILFDLVHGCEPTAEFPSNFSMELSYEQVMKMLLATPAQLADALLLTLGHEI